MKFDKLKPGMEVYDVHSERMGNTTMRSVGVWPVRILEVDAERRIAKVVWNGNVTRPETYGERAIGKLKESQPILIRSYMGSTRLPTREERKAIKASGIDKTTFRVEEVRELMEKAPA